MQWAGVAPARLYPAEAADTAGRGGGLATKTRPWRGLVEIRSVEEAGGVPMPWAERCRASAAVFGLLGWGRAWRTRRSGGGTAERPKRSFRINRAPGRPVDLGSSLAPPHGCGEGLAQTGDQALDASRLRPLAVLAGAEASWRGNVAAQTRLRSSPKAVSIRHSIRGVAPRGGRRGAVVDGGRALAPELGLLSRELRSVASPVGTVWSSVALHAIVSTSPFETDAVASGSLGRQGLCRCVCGQRQRGPWQYVLRSSADCTGMWLPIGYAGSSRTGTSRGAGPGSGNSIAGGSAIYLVAHKLTPAITEVGEAGHRPLPLPLVAWVSSLDGWCNSGGRGAGPRSGDSTAWSQLSLGRDGSAAAPQLRLRDTSRCVFALERQPHRWCAGVRGFCVWDPGGEGAWRGLVGGPVIAFWNLGMYAFHISWLLSPLVSRPPVPEIPFGVLRYAPQFCRRVLGGARCGGPLFNRQWQECWPRQWQEHCRRVLILLAPSTSSWVPRASLWRSSTDLLFRCWREDRRSRGRRVRLVALGHPLRTAGLAALLLVVSAAGAVWGHQAAVQWSLQTWPRRPAIYRSWRCGRVHAGHPWFLVLPLLRAVGPPIPPSGRLSVDCVRLALCLGILQSCRILFVPRPEPSRMRGPRPHLWAPRSSTTCTGTRWPRSTCPRWRVFIISCSARRSRTQFSSWRPRILPSSQDELLRVVSAGNVFTGLIFG